MKFACHNCDQQLEAEDSMAGLVVECPSCNHNISIPNLTNMTDDLYQVPPPFPSTPPPIRSSQASIHKEDKNSLYTRQRAGYAGALLLLIGVFTPVLSVPFGGSMTFFNNGRGDGSIILILALASIVLIHSKMYKGLWGTGGVSIWIIYIAFTGIKEELDNMRYDMQSELAGNPFRGITEVAMHSIQLQWGWAFLFVGAALILICAASKSVTQN